MSILTGAISAGNSIWYFRVHDLANAARMMKIFTCSLQCVDCSAESATQKSRFLEICETGLILGRSVASFITLDS